MPELDFEKITLNAIPDGEMPVFHASQFETMRPFIADLKWGSEVFAPGEGCWCTLSIRKTDDTLVIIDDIDIVTNTVSCILTQQSVACVGDNFCQLKVWSTEDDEDKCIACLNFILHVQPDPEAGGITSESEINNLTEQIEEITQQVIGDDYYDKTETDALLDAKADKSDTYTKSETNTLLSAKADASSVYTKSETNTLLSAKADASSVYTKSETNTLLSAKADASSVYTKSETNTLLSAKANSADLATVATTGDYDDLTNKPNIPAAQVQSDWSQLDNTKVDYIKNKPDLSVFVTSDDLNEIIYDLLPVGTASGATANFDTDLTMPLVDCKAYIVASQASGTPTPSTPLPITGYSSANITRCGVNLWDEEYIVNGNRIESKNFIVVKPNTTYHGVSPAGTGPTNGLLFYDINKNLMETKYSWGVGNNFTTPANCYFIKFRMNDGYGTTYNHDISINYPLTATAYKPYNGQTYTVNFGQTVYGGVLDVTRGKLSVTHANIASYNGESINEPWLSSMDVYVPNTTPTTGAQVVYPLTTPVEVELTPVQINALMGVNNVYNDTNGDTEVKYKDSIQHYIDTRI